MSRGGEVGPLIWGDGSYTLRLGIEEWRKVQEKCDAGPFELASRLYFPAQGLRRGLKMTEVIAAGLSGCFRIDDVREVVLRGLVGGGLTEHDASKIVRERIDEQMDIRNGVLLAYAVVEATIEEPIDDPLGEHRAGEVKPKNRSRVRKSASEASMPSAVP